MCCQVSSPDSRKNLVRVRRPRLPQHKSSRFVFPAKAGIHLPFPSRACQMPALNFIQGPHLPLDSKSQISKRITQDLSFHAR